MASTLNGQGKGSRGAIHVTRDGLTALCGSMSIRLVRHEAIGTCKRCAKTAVAIADILPAPSYERVTVRVAGRQRTYMLRDVRVAPSGNLAGTMVDETGDEIGGGKNQRHVLLAAPEDIVRRQKLAWSKHYGTLVVEV